ncbi:cystathionine beta-lyase [Sphingomonas changnyeongensis]|uniref:cystathionine beta-lyase n=1 Tax=Sphingomonas changnyeongensis TaxID=2698679 RepID=UPI001E451241|nr:cystathionine beta-lyase [Sphingomonas changnyeongensis]
MSGDSGAGDGLDPATRLVLAGRRPEWTDALVNPPVWRGSTVLYGSVAEMRARQHDTHHKLYYGRRGTPTQWALADALTALEPGAAGTLLYPSGVAAIAAALMSVLSAGDELLMVDSAYEPTRSLCDGLLARMGIVTRYYDPLVGGGIAELIGPRTRAIFLESPGSLTFEVQDVPAIVAVARAHGITTLIDNSWATPLFLPALALGVDLSILSCTKYVVGHSDALLGSVTAAPGRWQALRQASYQLGQHVGPDDAWLGLRGLRTLGVRLAAHRDNGLRVARWLAEQPEVAAVLHPGLPGCPGHDLFARDFRGASGLFSFVLAGGDDAARVALIDGLKLFGIGYSWGGFESLAIPADPQSLRTATRFAAAGPLVRLHVGLEDPGDLIADLAAGLARFRALRDGSAHQP